MINAYRPCGACAGYVPADLGCKHWKPGKLPSGPRSAAYKARNIQRQRQRRQEKALRERAREAVAEFRRTMTGAGPVPG